MTTDTKPDPLSWLRAEAWFPSRKADGVAATETLAYVARLQAQVAELQALSVTHIMTAVVPGDGSGQEVYAKSVADVEALLSKLGERAEEADSLQVQVDALAGALQAIRQYGSDTLSGRTDGPDDRAWQRAAVREMTKRASAALAAAAGR